MPVFTMDDFKESSTVFARDKIAANSFFVRSREVTFASLACSK